MDLRKDFRNASAGRRMRWASGFALAGILALGLAACGTSSGGANTGANCPDTSNLHLVQSGTLTIASDTTYKPAEFVDPNDPSKFAGYDIELGNEIAKRMCLTPHVVTATFGPELLTAIASPALGQQRYDMSISSWTISDDRLAVVEHDPLLPGRRIHPGAEGQPEEHQDHRRYVRQDRRRADRHDGRELN